MAGFQGLDTELKRIPAVKAFAKYLKVNFYCLADSLLPSLQRDQLQALSRRIDAHLDRLDTRHPYR